MTNTDRTELRLTVMELYEYSMHVAQLTNDVEYTVEELTAAVSGTITGFDSEAFRNYRFAKDCVGRCKACSALFGDVCYHNMATIDLHEADVARGYLADPDAADARVAARYLLEYGKPLPADQAEFGPPGGGQFLVPGPEKIRAAEEFASQSRSSAD